MEIQSRYDPCLATHSTHNSELCTIVGGILGNWVVSFDKNGKSLSNEVDQIVAAHN